MKLNNIFYYGPEGDRTFEDIAQKLLDCPNLTSYLKCEWCPHFAVCDKLFSHLSARAVRHGSLKPADVSFYRQEFLGKVGITI